MELISGATSWPSPIFLNALHTSTRARVDVAAESPPSARSVITLAQLDPYFRSLILAFTEILLSRKYSTAGLYRSSDRSSGFWELRGFRRGVLLPIRTVKGSLTVSH